MTAVVTIVRLYGMIPMGNMSKLPNKPAKEPTGESGDHRGLGTGSEAGPDGGIQPDQKNAGDEVEDYVPGYLCRARTAERGSRVRCAPAKAAQRLYVTSANWTRVPSGSRT